MLLVHGRTSFLDPENRLQRTLIDITDAPEPADLLPAIETMWELSAGKIERIENDFDPEKGAPVFTAGGKYTAQGWTEWTQGFQYGASLLQFDATGEKRFLELGRQKTVRRMASHVTHIGVHDHGFNNVSTYGALLRLMQEEKIPDQSWERHFYELALKCSGAVQAARWTSLPDGTGYIYSFNGPHSLFSDTVRSLRALVMAHQLGHALMGENDQRISLLRRTINHLLATSRYNVYFGEGRDAYDVWGRVVHESIFNLNDGQYRCPSSQQGYSPFSTWTRGLAWILLGFSEQLEFFSTLPDSELTRIGWDELENILVRTARATADFHIENTPSCGVPYWDTGAPNLHRLGAYLDVPADPYNEFEPVDSSAAAISAQGLIRLGHYLENKDPEAAARYLNTGLKTLKTLLDVPYLSKDSDHQGLLLHSIYHRPRDWDVTQPGQHIPNSESCMWGDYHLRELALLVQRMAAGAPYYTFFLNH